MIEVKGLTKKYGAITAVDDISFTVRDGEILGFLGPNGAGKSTTMNIITGYLSSTAGTVTVGGHEILEEPLKAKAGIGYLPEQPPLYPDMTVREYLSFLYDLKRLRLDKKVHIAETCQLVGIGQVTGRLIRNLSKGYRQRVGLAQALLGNPGVLILDEPTVGLDPKQIIEIRELIRELGKRHTVILSSHILPEIQTICERVLVLAHGRIIADGAPEALARSLSADHSLTARVDGPIDGVLALLQKLPGVAGAQLIGPREGGACHDYLIEPGGSGDVRRELFHRLADRGWPLLGLSLNQLSLEEVFLQLTGEEAAPVAESNKKEAEA